MRYRRIMPRIWHDEKFAQLDTADAHIALYLLSGPESNRIGLYRLSLEKAAVDTKITDGTFRERFHNVCQTFDWRFDDVSKTLFIPSWIHYNEPENRNVMAGNLRDLEDVPNNPFMYEFSELIRQHPKAPKKFPKRLANVTPTVTVAVAVSVAGTVAVDSGNQTDCGSASESAQPPLEDPLAEYPHIAEWWEALTSELNRAKPAAKIPKDGSKDWFTWRDTLAKLVRIDGFTEEQVCQTIRWVIRGTTKQAEFWRENFYSFAPLRSKTKSGVSKFQMMFDQKNPNAGFTPSLEDDLEKQLLSKG